MMNDRSYEDELEILGDAPQDQSSPEFSVQLFLNKMADYALLSREEEQALLHCYHEKHYKIDPTHLRMPDDNPTLDLFSTLRSNEIDDKKTPDQIAAYQKLMLCNMRYVYTLTGKFSGHGGTRAELFQVGTIGLARGIEKYNLESGSKLLTYAASWIYSNMQDYRRGTAHTTQFVRANPALYARITNYKSKFYNQTSLSDDQIKQISTDLKVSINVVRRMEEAMSAPTVSIVDEHDFDGSLGDSNYGHVLADDSLNPEKEASLNDTKKALQQSLSVLTGRARKIIEMRYFSDGSVTLDAVSEVFGLSRERVRQIEAESLKILRAEIERKHAIACSPGTAFSSFEIS